MYAELYARSNYSFLKGASHPHELVEQAHKLGYQAIALTDECSFAGVVKAHMAAKACGIKLIVGAEFILPEGCFVLLATNRKAYGEISALISKSRRRAEKGSYQLSLDDLLEGLTQPLLLFKPSWPEVTLLAGSDWSKSQAEYQAEIEATLERIKEYWLGRSYWLMSRNLIPGESAVLGLWQQLAGKYQLPCVAAGDILMHSKQRQMLADVLACIRHGCSLQQAGSRVMTNSERLLKPLESLEKRYPADWLANTLAISKRCDFSLDELRYEYPAEIIPEGLSASEYLRREVEAGARRRFGNTIPEKVRLQYERELEIISELSYEYFFLTIYDIVQFAKFQGILHQGRGSAANSVVCFCLGITEVDPTKVNMLFERFISKERDEPPDIDVDFEHERREEVIQYIYGKYGRERAALAATVISYRFKSAMGDVGKVLGLSQGRITQLINGIDRRDPEFSYVAQLSRQSMLPTEGLGRFLLPLVSELIGFPRHLSQHVGGFIISSGPLSELVPVENAAMVDRTVIQWDKDDLESLGLLKVDVLALGMLTAIRKCFHLLDKHGPAPGQALIAGNRRIDNMSLSDVVWEQPEVYEMLSRADSIGVFQVESRAQMSMLPRLRPKCYYDLVIQIAIVRPGPIQGDMVHPFLLRRDGKEEESYPSEEVRHVLERTLGVPIFQEQVIQLAMVAAGFTGGEADQLRRAMAAWKRTGQLQQFESKLLNGMAERGYKTEFAQQVFNQIKGFGEYGFPESHSASFALLAYVSAYLKHHYPAAFCCALLNSHPMGFYSPSQLVQDARRHGVKVLPVCINHSQWDHTLEALDGVWAIRLGFRQVKGVSGKGISALLDTRPESGFSGLTAIRSLLPANELEALADADAFACLGGNRHQVRWALSSGWLGLQQSLPLFEKELEDVSLDGSKHEAEIAMPVPGEIQSMVADFGRLGLSLGRHPIAILREQGLLIGCRSAVELHECRHGQIVTVAGVVTGRQRPGTASGVTFITLEDETGNTNVVVWLATARAQRQAYLLANILKVSGTVEIESGVVHLVAGKLQDISDAVTTLDVKSRDFR
ncbi:error-prone DNA polymerase [Shewanella submarina]|uniref:Error-prone DNA polymerase n=1 Tax=Shewanella submarina TaxID=2016376 RepID=A0ABV7GHJ9_9GAMM|nr:error-prone DNA polymerase [Shewanella submarina]MCL1038176.1 error-prone DNA polymerase [Shewanella submarina]